MANSYSQLLREAEGVPSEDAFNDVPSIDGIPYVDPNSLNLAAQPEEQPEAQSVPSDITSLLQRAGSREPQPASIEQAAPEPKGPVSDYLKRFKDAQARSKEDTALANVMDSSQGFLKAGLMYGGVTPEQANKVITSTGYDRIRQQAAKEPEAITQEMGVESADRKLTEEKDLRDPSSEVSKQYRAIAAQSGLTIPENATAYSLEKTYGYLFRAKEAQENRAARKEEMALRREAMQSEKEARKADKDSKSQQDFAVTSNKVMKTAAENFQKATDAVNRTRSLDPKSSNLAEQVTLLYDTIKGLDPGSVVREGEISLLTSGGTIQGKASVIFEKLKNNPRILDTKVVDQLKKQMERLYEAQRNGYSAMAEPWLKQAAKRGISENDFDTLMPHYDKIKAPSAPEAISDKDREALKWANENPKDPRALKIKQKLGM